MPRRFSASSAAQLMACPGSANLELSIPGFVEPVRDDAAGAKGVGTRLHEILEQVVDWTVIALFEAEDTVREWSKQHYLKRREQCDDLREMIDWCAAQSWKGPVVGVSTLRWMQQLREFPPALLRFVADALAYLARLKMSITGVTQIEAEVKLTADWLDSAPQTTADVVIFSGGNRVDVLDWKTGKIPVSPVANSQLLFYAWTVIHDIPNISRIVMHVAQPGNLDSWECTRSFIERWASKARATDRLIAAKSTDLRPSDYCTFCPANPHSRGDRASVLCPAMMEKLYPSTLDEDAILDL